MTADLAAPVSPAGAGMDPRLWHPRRSCRGFPRRRGDGPRTADIGGAAFRFPPQARGWTEGGGAFLDCDLVSPAGAGMDPRLVPSPGRRSSFPRRRGDGPSEPGRSGHAAEFPPQARGWTVICASLREAISVSPAGAGMDPPSTHPVPRRARFPRRRGDGPAFSLHRNSRLRFPPQARGWTGKGRPLGRRVRVSPAGAGMDRRLEGRTGRRRGFPRRRGDGPHDLAGCYPARRFPPQARGWTMCYSPPI